MITIIIGNPFPSLFEDYFFFIKVNVFISTQLLFVRAIKFGLETFKICVIRICADKENLLLNLFLCCTRKHIRKAD